MSRLPHRVRLKYCADVVMGQSPPSSEYSDNPDAGLPFLQGSAGFGDIHPLPDTYCGTPNKIAAVGDILFSVRAPVGTMNRADQQYGIGRGLCAIRAKRETTPEFLWWALHEARGALATETTGSTYEAVSVSDVANMYIVLPSPEQQRAIASDLDRETARIDALIAAKRELVARLGEKRQTLVARVVTRGLDPDVPMRDSGVPWIGKVPVHWDVERGRWLFTERDERSEEGDEEMLTVSHLTGVTKRSEKDVNMFEAKSTVGYKVVHPGDLAINTLWAWMGAMGSSPHYGIVSPAYHVYELGPRLLSAYVDALVRTERFVREVTRYSKGVWSSRLRLYPAEFFDVLFPVPPLAEQRAIADEIKRQSAALDAVARETRRSIELLKERRAALISATVTGKRRVA